MERIIREKERHARTGVSRREWDRMEAKGRAPRRVRIGQQIVGWVEAEVVDWVKARIAERDGVAA